MNKKQNVIIVIGLAILFAMFLYPPWESSIRTVTFQNGYHFILDPPDNISDINYVRIILQSFIVMVIVVSSVFLSKDSSDNNPKN